MWFVSGGFYFVPDPDRVHTAYPGSKPPTSRMRREYNDQGRTLVGTFTDPLDAYYYSKEGTSSRSAGCPRRQDLPSPLRQIVDDMRSHDAPGWFRVGADIDSYAPEAQKKIATAIEHTLARHSQDGGFHTFTAGGTDDSGCWVFIFAVGQDTVSNRDHLERYLTAKNHQQRADRALGVLMDSSGSLLMTAWLSYPPSTDPGLDALARAMRLVPPHRAPNVAPPQAKASKKVKKRRAKGKNHRRK